jgi:stress-induced morphogen
MFLQTAIQELVQKALPESRIQLVDMTGGGDHWELTVISGAFEGKGAVDRHRMIYAILGDKISSGEIHALKLNTLTPGEAGK